MKPENVLILDCLENQGCLSATLSQTIEEWLGCSVTMLKSAADVEYLFRTNDQYAKCPLIFLSQRSCEALDQEVFRLHCVLRQQNRKIGSSWEGGLIIVPVNMHAADSLLANAVYKHLSGHAVLSFPVCFLELLAIVDRIGELYRGAWALAAEKAGLAVFWRFVDATSASLDQCNGPAAIKNMNLAIDEIVNNGVLKRLLPHVEVFRQTESIQQQLENSVCLTKDQMRSILNHLCTIMSDYKL